ncbi:thermonuclease family protein [Pedobacter aquatilis]|uniref:thermonuclease family protein n=1 Tax=Pedobacter aquatilis TaxID=351343 RepID=UPI00292DF848|nr:thermonuclease family protein [Pedobacter aquatilis]
MDGDTMEVLYQSQPIRIRLAHIDCPEKRNGQPFGNNAKKALSDLCFGETVKIESQNYDRYKRLIAVVFNKKGQNINQEMVKQGMAWHYKKYSKDNTYAALESTAKIERIGLWKDANPIAPWVWRKPVRTKPRP